MTLLSDEFINYFEELKQRKETNLDLKSFLIDHLTNKTPKKLQAKYLSNKNDFIKSIRECILYNLYLNTNFYNYKLPLEYFEGFYVLFKTKEDKFDESQFAQLILCLHFSKGQFDFSCFTRFFYVIKSLKVVEFNDFEYYTEIIDFYNQIIKNKYLIEKIEELIFEITGSTSNYEFDKTKICFFTLADNSMNGFAGIDKVYINIFVLINLQKEFTIRIKNYSKEEMLVILKMRLLAIVLHEITHVAIRFKKGDVNMSTPEEKNKVASKSIGPICDEAGVLIEKKIFKKRINWRQSAANNLNIAYCNDYLKSLLGGLKPEFELEKANAVINDLPYAVLAIDLDEDFFIQGYY